MTAPFSKDNIPPHELVRQLQRASAFQILSRHLHQAFPLEGCGYALLSPTTQRVVPCDNVLGAPPEQVEPMVQDDHDPRHHGFEVSEHHQLQICAALEQPDTYVVLAHGHPHGTAHPSKHDVHTAAALGTRVLHWIMEIRSHGVVSSILWAWGPMDSNGHTLHFPSITQPSSRERPPLVYPWHFENTTHRGMFGLHAIARTDADGQIIVDSP